MNYGILTKKIVKRSYFSVKTSQFHQEKRELCYTLR